VGMQRYDFSILVKRRVENSIRRHWLDE